MFGPKATFWNEGLGKAKQLNFWRRRDCERKHQSKKQRGYMILVK